MRFFIALCATVILVACNAPSAAFRGIAPTRVTVQGSTFDVRLHDGRAEAIRVNAQYAPRFGPIQARAGAAMAMVSCGAAAASGRRGGSFWTKYQSLELATALIQPA